MCIYFLRDSIARDLPNYFISSIVTLNKLYLLFSIFYVDFVVSTTHNSRGLVPQENDPNTRYICKGILGEHAACLCNEDEQEVACINAQFVDTGVFQYANSHYSNLRRVTFHGNNFQDLPDEPLFGDTKYSSMNVLNISANYIVNLHSNALKAVPNIQVLDLSNNEIVLTETNIDFLTHTPRLTHLYLRRAFTSVINRTQQFDLLMRMFRKANLKHLKVLDLSYNYFNVVPYDLPCPFPSISKLDLRQNVLRTVSMNTSCLESVDMIDLSRNHFRQLDEKFRKEFANFLPPHSLLLRNSFHCDCNSNDWVQWVRSTDVIREKNLLTCARSSPADFTGARLVEVPLHRLNCDTDLESNGLLNDRRFSWTLIILATFLCRFVPFFHS
ncbi:leucine rich repeat domain-containing protein [Ditylenchus destructor]|nr:leucine rich repeat domain-containing protein [Ditylenchus destructor]